VKDPGQLRPSGVRASTAYIAEAESLRGIAILLVFLHHANFYTTQRDGTAVVPVMPVAFAKAGHTGVSLFFILSAFLLSLPFFAEVAGGRRVVRSAFYARRALRILPLYYVAVMVGAVLAADHLRDLARAIPYLLFLNSVAGWTVQLRPYGNVWWSLATEVQFYLLLPLLPVFLRSRAGRRCGALVVVAYAVAYAAFLAGRLHTRSVEGAVVLSHSLFGRAPFFLFGIVAAWIYGTRGARLRDAAARVRWLRGGGADALLLAVVSALGLVLEHVAQRGYWPMETPPRHVWHVLEAALWTAVVLLILVAPLRAKPVVSNRFLGTIGVLSYSIYLVHLPIVDFGLRAFRAAGVASTSWEPGTIVAVGTVALATLALSAVTYRVIERPFLVRKSRLDGQADPHSAAPWTPPWRCSAREM
jgi:peptidoglycan/LPS O-acetylase OafA/YrhL